MAYGEWASITIAPKGITVSIKNASLEWGKFYKNGEKDDEISPGDINQITIGPGKSAVINTCGREDADSGTEGSFDLYDGQTKMGTYNWDCPWGSSTNVSTWSSASDPTNPTYTANISGANLDGGALGNIHIQCFLTPV